MASKAQKVKKAVKKKTPVKAAIKSSSPTAKKSGIAGVAKGLASKLSGASQLTSVLGLGASRAKGKSGFLRRKTAKQALKKAYETRAMRKIRQGNLGQARRDLRKKATVI
jgi:hypothetical protein